MQSAIFGESMRSFAHSWKRYLGSRFLGTRSRNHTPRVWTHPGRCLASTTNTQEIAGVKDAQVVVCGGGISGVSVAYHLAKKGFTDVVLLEQGSLTSGTTWHAAGLVGLLKADTDRRELARYSADLYETLEQETGVSTGYKRTGSVYLAANEDRLVQLKQLAVGARWEGLECHLLNPSELQDIVPWISVKDLVGGIYSPCDGVTDPTDTVMSLARGAKMNGVKFVENVGLKRILTTDGRVRGVETEQGHVIRCEYFVNAAGMWSRHVGQMSTPPVTVPMHPNQHQYAVFLPIKGVNYNTPYVRDWDHGIYIREWSEGLMVGAFVQNGKPVYLDGKPPNSGYISLQDDYEQFDPHFEAFLKRVPTGKKLEMRQLFCGPESFSPDMAPIVGEVPEIRNYFVISGFHSQGITFAGGAGRYVADWIVDGKPSRYMTCIDSKRFAPHHNRLDYMLDRASESEGKLYKQVPPTEEFDTGRKLCCTTLHDDLSKFRAVFGEVIGIEQPLYFDKGGSKQSRHENIYGKPYWFDTVIDEYQACADGVGVVDMSAMTLLELQSNGNECRTMLQRLCTSNISTLPGSFTNTWMLNEDGHIVNDCIVVCLEPNRYLLMSPAKQWTSAKQWLSQQLQGNQSILLKDLTPGSEEYKSERYAILSVIGSKAESVFHRLTGDNRLHLSGYQNRCLQYGSNGHILTTTLAGYSGFLLMLPSQIAQEEYKKLLETNKDLGMRNVGSYALRWMQIENSIPLMGVDFDINNIPMEITLSSHSVDFQKDVQFIGQAALTKLNAEHTPHQLVLFTLDHLNVHNDLWPWGLEPIYHNRQMVGLTTSAAYSPSCGKIVCLGMIRNGSYVSSSIAGSDMYEVDIAGKRYGASLSASQVKLETKMRI